jgi:anti-sigma factor RsiW
MNAPRCDRIGLDDLADYAAGELPEAETAAIEAHVFACADCGRRAAEVEALGRAVRAAVQSEGIAGFVTDAILNRFAREGARVRTFALTPDAIVPCAVWEGDELLALRLSADFRGVREVVMSEHAAGAELVRAHADVAAGQQDVIYVLPASWVRQLPAGEIDIVLAACEDGHERPIGRYTLVHEGSLHREANPMP